LLALITLLVGCARARAPEAKVSGRPEKQEVVKEVEKVVVVEKAAEEPAAGLPYKAPAPGMPGDEAALQGLFAERKVIRTADLAIVVEDTQAAIARLRAIAITYGGYVAEANVWQVKENLMRGTVTLRVDAERFDEVLDRIREIALEVQRENIGSQDVTEEYVDLQARLRNLEATEQELLALLKEVRERTRSADEVLQVYRELTRIREEIERIKGRMQYLENRVQLATITVELIPKEEKPIVEPGWHPGQTLRNALGALASAAQALVSAAIWLVIFVLPLLLAIGAPVGLIVVGVRRWWRGRPAREAA